MKYILNRIDFINEKLSKEDKKEKKSPKSTPETFKKDIENIIDVMFDKARKIKYTGSGYPVSVEFEITEKEYKLDYSEEEIKSELEEGASVKREFLPILKFDKKEKREDKFFIKFEIIKKNASSDEFKMKDIVDFDKYTGSDLRKMLQKDDFNARQKEEMEEILKERGEKRKTKDSDDLKDEKKKKSGLKDDDIVIKD